MMKKLLFGKTRFSRADPFKIGGGAGDVNDAPFVNELRLGDYHLQMIDGSWQLMNGATPPATPTVADANIDEMKAEIRRLTQLANELQKQNHRLQFKNQILIAMCTISGRNSKQESLAGIDGDSEGDRQIAELENEQLLKSNSLAKPQLA